MYFQLIMCTSIFIFGFFINIARGSPTFAPSASLTGALWAVGNTMCVPIIARLGMGLGLVMWSGSCMLTGWSASVFGLPGVAAERDQIASWPLNITGVAVAFVALLCAMRLGTIPDDDTPTDDKDGRGDGYVSLAGDSPSVAGTPGRMSVNDTPFAGLSAAELGLSEPAFAPAAAAPAPTARDKLVGAAMAVVAGMCFGLNFAGVQFAMQHHPERSQVPMDYAFSHFTGILVASVFLFVGYAAYEMLHPAGRGTPEIPDGGRVTVGAFVSGIMWAIAQTSWFIGNDALSPAITWPLAVVGPSAVAALWGVVLGEVRGRKKIIALGGVIAASAVAAGLVVASKK